MLHASRIPTRGGDAIAVIIDSAAAAEVAPIIMLAYGLSTQERVITGLVCQGMSTIEIATETGISTNTVQDHLKSIFGKVGVRSRRELVVQILRDHYVRHAQAGGSIGPSESLVTSPRSGATGHRSAGSDWGSRRSVAPPTSPPVERTTSVAIDRWSSCES